MDNKFASVINCAMRSATGIATNKQKRKGKEKNEKKTRGKKIRKKKVLKNPHMSSYAILFNLIIMWT